MPRTPRFAPAAVQLEHRADGARWLRSPQPLGPIAVQVGEWLRRFAAQPQPRRFLCEREPAGGEWRELDYAAARRAVDALSALLLERGLGPRRPLVLLSDNGIDHALLTLAAMQVGIPAAPISPAYALLARDLGRLAAMVRSIDPGAVYVDDGRLFAPALAAAVPAETLRLWSTAPPPGDAPALAVRENLWHPASAEVERAFAAVGPDTVAKLLFTSGSTGTPKAVITTQRMLCSNQKALQLVWPSLTERPPRLLDWLPWSHCFGGNFNAYLVLANGGTLHVDGGKPLPGRFEQTLANLRAVAPTHYFNVPRGFGLLVPALERDRALAEHFFSELELIFYAAAALPQDLWRRLERLALEHRGAKVAMVSAWGSTETAPLATAVHFPIPRAGVIGLPVPGTELALVRSAEKWEARVRGPQVTPGYWNAPELTAAAFDEHGFYRIGDALRLFDEARPELGLEFDGRVAEDFKLSSGTWVSVGVLRPEFLTAAGDLLVDAVVAGHDRDGIGLLCLPNPARIQALTAHLPATASLAERLAEPAVGAALAEALARHNQQHPARRERIERALWLVEPLSIDAGEITDKGYVNQRAVLRNRAALVEQLFGGGAEVVVPMSVES
jgi:feruloyl-CoA synthase